MTTYKAMKAEHRCVKCGAQDERTLSGKAKCKICAKIQNARQRERYRRLISANKCAFCGAIDERTKAGGVMCEECAARSTIYRELSYDRKRREHLCCDCGKKLPDNYWYARCEHCREKVKARRCRKKGTGNAAVCKEEQS